MKRCSPMAPMPRRGFTITGKLSSLMMVSRSLSSRLKDFGHGMSCSMQKAMVWALSAARSKTSRSGTVTLVWAVTSSLLRARMPALMSPTARVTSGLCSLR